MVGVDIFIHLLNFCLPDLASVPFSDGMQERFIINVSLEILRNCNHVAFQQDFEACTQALHCMGYSNPQLTAARGTSAGGLIVGAVCNRSPGLFKAAILRVSLLLVSGIS